MSEGGHLVPTPKGQSYHLDQEDWGKLASREGREGAGSKFVLQDTDIKDQEKDVENSVGDQTGRSRHFRKEERRRRKKDWVISQSIQGRGVENEKEKKHVGRQTKRARTMGPTTA